MSKDLASCTVRHNDIARVFLTVLMISLLGSGVKAQTSSRADWFRDARFGMFIHWGLYSAAEGLWEGEGLRDRNQYAEWIRYRNRISKEDYGALAKRFVWDEIDPEQWVILAKEAGMKYIIITAKHHDGVAIWDTKVGDYSLPKLAGVHRDVIKEIADACRKHGLKLGFYYSHWIDWAHPYGWDHNMELKGRPTDAQYNQYWQEKVIPQVRELLTNYGDIAIMWFDMWIPYQQSIIKKEQLVQLAEMIRTLQPNCLINSRLGLPPDSKYVDYETLQDNAFGTEFINRPWATPGTIEHSWGYNSQDKDYKSVSQLFESLAGNVSLNGGFTLNIGPRANGAVPYESVSRLKEMGNWLKKYGESIYGNTGMGLKGFDWGRVTYNEHTKKIYLHIFNWPLEDTLRFTGVSSGIKGIDLLDSEGNAHQLEYIQSGPVLHIRLPKEQTDPYHSIVRISVSDPVIDKEAVAESSFGGFSLNTSNAINNDKVNIVPYKGNTPAYTKVKSQTLKWKVFLPQAGRYSVSISAHNPAGSDIPVLISVGDKEIRAKIHPDGKVVVEPNQNNYADEFVEHHLGETIIQQPQSLTVTFQSPEKREIWLNHIWIERK